ncbi:MAG: tetratricopeptide repeat protein, partial [Candidatus Omnitrophica bacterium]|nr:tetratricopeptide repeat protein [Candidatus Omnitrophota bacterium]
KNIGHKPAEAIAKDLGLKERKIKRFLEKQKEKQMGHEGRGVSSANGETSPNLIKFGGQHTPASVGKRNVILSVILIIILGFAVYGNSINGEFIWDDTHLVKDNVYIRDWSNLSKFFTESMGSGADAATVYSFYRPVQMITYAIDYSFWKLDVRGYHLTNVFLHVLASLTVFWFITVLYKDWRLSLFTSLFFVAHPMHTEAVSYISGRADSLALIFMILCFIFYIKVLREGKGIYYILMTVSYVLAVLSKELSLILPFLLLLFHYTFHQKLKLKAILPVLALNGSYIIARFTFLSFLSSHVVHPTTFVQRLAGFFIAITKYIRIVVLPLDLHMEYGNSFFKLTHPQAGIGAIAVLALFILILITKPARNIVFFSLVWFFVALFPVSNLYPINAYMAEHWLYLPSIGIFLMMAWAINAGAYCNTPLRKGLIVLCLLIFYSYLTIKQNDYWKTPIPFYERTLKYANRSSRVYFNLANEYRSAGQNEKAVSLYKKAVEIKPDYVDAYYNLGKAHVGLGEKEEAMAVYQKVIKSDPGYKSARYNLGNVYYRSGRYDEAVRLYEQEIEINPGHVKAYNNIGVAYINLGRKEEAERLFKKAIRLDPDHEMAYGNLAILYFGQQKYGRAVEYYEKAEKLGFVDPKFLQKITPYRGKPREFAP